MSSKQIFTVYPLLRRRLHSQKDQFASSILESNLGYHVVRVIDKRAPKVLLLDDPILPGQSTTVRNQIRNRLLLEKQQETLQQAVQEAVNDLRERAEINTFVERI